MTSERVEDLRHYCGVNGDQLRHSATSSEIDRFSHFQFNLTSLETLNSKHVVLPQLCLGLSSIELNLARSTMDVRTDLTNLTAGYEPKCYAKSSALLKDNDDLTRDLNLSMTRQLKEKTVLLS